MLTACISLLRLRAGLSAGSEEVCEAEARADGGPDDREADTVDCEGVGNLSEGECRGSPRGEPGGGGGGG